MRYYFTEKMGFQKGEKSIILSSLSIYHTWKNISKKNKNNKFSKSTPTWNNKLELPDGSYSISDIQDYFQYIMIVHETFADDPSIKIYINKVENRITCKIKTG